MAALKQFLCLSALYLHTLAAAIPLSQGAEASAKFPSITNTHSPLRLVCFSPFKLSICPNRAYWYSIRNVTTKLSNSANSTIISISSGVTNNTAQSTNCSGLTSGSSQFWYEAISHNGESSYLTAEEKANYSVFRNVVTAYGADNTGTSDASTAIQNAINSTLSCIPQK